MRLLLALLITAGCAPPPQDGQPVGTLELDQEPAAAPIPASDSDQDSEHGAQPVPPARGEAYMDTPPAAIEALPEVLDDGLLCEICEDMPRMESKTRYPIVLAHGMAGFDSFGPLEYWGGADDTLRAQGFAAYVSVVEPLNGSDVRGEQLADFIDRVRRCTCSEMVNVIGHSQGGIDLRYVINVLGYGDRVASATSIASPHRGTRVADISLGLVPGAFDVAINAILWLIAEIYTDPQEDVVLRNALTWCSTAHLAQFAKDYPDDPRVPWYSYAGRAGISALGIPECQGFALSNPKKKAVITAPLLPSWTLLGGLLGKDNDGLVTVASAQWGEFRGCLPADHVQEIGMFVGVPAVFGHKAFYLDHARFLESRGH